ncbi:MAG: hypothetical protein HYV63_05225 [Candidatus Schekmanbacteria bacterium]|nr:hypothetical protein [Candidatus Schekmanbacteria bacterium]
MSARFGWAGRREKMRRIGRGRQGAACLCHHYGAIRHVTADNLDRHTLRHGVIRP